MKIKHILLPLVAVTLCGCSKTNKLYNEGAYNSSNFDLNYYSSEDKIDFNYVEKEETPLELACNNNLSGLHAEDVKNYVWEDSFNNDKEKLWGYHNNLSSIETSFNYGVLSKLYDGRVRCDGLYQMSRVQLDKIGYETVFPKTMKSCDYFAFSCRGGTTLKQPLQTKLEFNFTVSFYTQDKDSYIKHIYHLNNLKVDTDNSSRTSLISFYFDKSNFPISNTVAMSFEWECVDPTLESHNLSDDKNVKEKDHLAIMLYEVFFGNSIWF